MSGGHQHGRPGGRYGRYGIGLTVLAALLAVGGLLSIVGFVSSEPDPPPQPPAAAADGPTARASTSPTTSSPIAPSTGRSARKDSHVMPTRPAVRQPGGASSPARTPTPTSVGPVLPRSKPVRLDITSIGVHSTLITLGTNPDGSVQVPPLDGGAPAGWYRGSPTPGQLGPAVILGHVDDDQGPAVFYDLGDLEPGARISVARADHRVAVFRVDRVDSYPKDRFPTTEVYGNTDRAELRLITCGGTWNPTIGHYDHNIVAYATLVSSHPA
ncbi:class F sortase [Segeticoccus rhizosphaerae]|uniref:class F sortase n=1 Tax=Segeticoccus rhizosphaerae TaxID=1104777 RepID=UPI001EE4AA01|nr:MULTISPECIES: class F sortase [Intrasporangiaceae]